VLQNEIFEGCYKMTGIIDADAHITEPADVWTSRLPAKYVDDIPHVARSEDGRDVWVLDDEVLCTIGATAPVGYQESRGNTATYDDIHPLTYDDIHVASYDSVERLRYMDEANIWAQVLYPNVAGFGAQKFLKMGDADLRLKCVSAFNDFLHEWISADPRRLIASISLPFWDIEASVKEIDRCLALGGFRGVLFTGEPQRFGMPLLGHHHWDPLYARAQEAGLPLQFHLGGGENEDPFRSKISDDRRGTHGLAGYGAYMSVELFLKNAMQCTDIISSGALNRFPELKVVSVESGIGWVPFTLEAADYNWRTMLYEDRTRNDDWLLPSEIFARQVYTTMWFEQVAPEHLLDVIPVNRVMFETDFPHISCLYGNIEETIKSTLGAAPVEAQRKILWENAAELYHIPDPGPEDKVTKLSDELVG
jgi:uncharacterized protein